MLIQDQVLIALYELNSEKNLKCEITYQEIYSKLAEKLGQPTLSKQDRDSCRKAVTKYLKKKGLVKSRTENNEALIKVLVGNYLIKNVFKTHLGEILGKKSYQLYNAIKSNDGTNIQGEVDYTQLDTEINELYKTEESTGNKSGKWFYVLLVKLWLLQIRNPQHEPFFSTREIATDIYGEYRNDKYQRLWNIFNTSCELDKPCFFKKDVLYEGNKNVAYYKPCPIGLLEKAILYKAVSTMKDRKEKNENSQDVRELFDNIFECYSKCKNDSTIEVFDDTDNGELENIIELDEVPSRQDQLVTKKRPRERDANKATFFRPPANQRRKNSSTNVSTSSLNFSQEDKVERSSAKDTFPKKLHSIDSNFLEQQNTESDGEESVLSLQTSNIMSDKSEERDSQIVAETSPHNFESSNAKSINELSTKLTAYASSMRNNNDLNFCKELLGIIIKECQKVTCDINDSLERQPLQPH